ALVSHGWLVLELGEDETGVVPAEPEVVRESDVRLPLARLVRDVVEVALGIRVLVVDRRRHDVALHREDRRDRLDRARRAEAVPRRALGRRDRRLARLLLAEGDLDHTRLARVAERSRRSVGI